MWVSALPWDAIGQGALSEAIGSLAVTVLLTGGSWTVRGMRRRRRNKGVVAPAVSTASPSKHEACSVPDTAVKQE